MDARFADLRRDVLSLPTAERAVLAVELLASLDDDVSEDDPGEVDLAWGVEMVRRSQQITSGEVETLSWTEVLEHFAAGSSDRVLPSCRVRDGHRIE